MTRKKANPQRANAGGQKSTEQRKVSESDLSRAAGSVNPADLKDDKIRWALRLAEMGFLIIRLPEDSKEPEKGIRWSALATRNPDTIRGWFEGNPRRNWGASPDERFAVVDVDTKDGKRGDEALSGIEADQDLDDWITGNTLAVRTPSGGTHYYVRTPHAVSNSAGRFAEDVDVRGLGGYVVGPYSTIDGVPYEPVGDSPVMDCPSWALERMTAASADDRRQKEPLFDLDTEEAKHRGLEFLMHRPPAIEGAGGDEHTYVTMACLQDFGLSVEGCLEVATTPFTLDGESESQSWNDRCSPPWDERGMQNSLEAKARSAWKSRQTAPGSKGGAADAFDDAEYLASAADDNADDNADSADRPSQSQGDYTDSDSRYGRWAGRVLTVSAAAEEIGNIEYLVPEFIIADGVTAFLATRGTGKTVLLTDLALSAATDRDWQGLPLAEGYHAIFMAGEDANGSLTHIRAWMRHHGVEGDPERFRFVDMVPDLLDSADCERCARYLRSILPEGSRAIVIVDTLQRATARGGANSDEDVNVAMHNLEGIARSVGGPGLIACHPPKDGRRTILGSSISENATKGIVDVEEDGPNKRATAKRIKGKGEDNYVQFHLESVGLGEADQFGNEVSGAVAVNVGTLTGLAADTQRRADYAYPLKDAIIAEGESRTENGERITAMSVSGAARGIAHAEKESGGRLPGREKAKRELPKLFYVPFHYPGENLSVGVRPTGRHRGSGEEREVVLKRHQDEIGDPE